MKTLPALFAAAAIILSAPKVEAQSGVSERGTQREAAFGALFGDGEGVTISKSDFITLRKAGNRLWFEIPVRYMGREMLMASTLSNISSGRFGSVGYKEQKPLHIRFTMQDSTLYVRQVSREVTTDYMSEEALGRVNMEPVLWSYPIAAWGPDGASVVVETTELFLDNPARFSFFPEGAVSFSPTLDKEASRLDGIKAFDDNLSVKSTLVFTVSADEVADNDPVTAGVTRSILLLPESKMTPRISDSRVGVFGTDKTRFAATDDGSRAYSVANRWRVVPSDVEAYERGELVEPTKKIVFWIENTFPDSWKEPLKRAVESWNKPFEAIGFKNVMEARPFPTPEEDPDFDPDNLKYSCIRFLPSNVPNAMGPSWVDPSTGEVISASVIVWSDVVKLINKWRFVQTAQVDPRVRSRKMPYDVFIESLQYVIAHEVGHTLGFAHSMASSAAWPVDSLRSAAFTHRYGTTPSIMDYARFNYIAQRDDVEVALAPPEIGVYDYFLVKWTYRYLPQFSDEWEEQATVEGWVDAVAGDSVYRYGRQQLSARYDPSALDEDLGDDPIIAGDYGIDNLKYILSNLDRWISDDPDYEHRRMLYGEIGDQYYRYVRNVLMNVGGIYLTRVKEGTPGRQIAPVPKSVQKESLRWAMHHFKDMEWLDEPSLAGNLTLGTDGAAGMRGRIADEIRAKTANVALSSHYARIFDERVYDMHEFARDLYHHTWASTRAGRHPTAGERALQKAMVDMFCEPVAAMNAAGSSTAIAGHTAGAASTPSASARQSGKRNFGEPGMDLQDPVDVSSFDDSAENMAWLAVRSQSLLRRAVARSSGSTRAHYRALLMKLNVALKDKL